MVCVVPYNSTTYLTCKVSASRAKCQIYLSISETQPNFGTNQHMHFRLSVHSFIHTYVQEQLSGKSQFQPFLFLTIRAHLNKRMNVRRYVL